MKNTMKKFMVLVFVLVLFCSIQAANASAAFTSSSFISNEKNRQYIDSTISYYLEKNSDVISAINSGNSAVFIFEGGSDNVDDASNNNLSNRVSAVCIVVKKDSTSNKPYIAFKSENCSTMPDHPLAYGAFSHGYGSSYGTATLKDGVYNIYTVNHKGQYAGLNVRDDNCYVPAVYMKSDGGFSELDASGINMHTRTMKSVSGKTNPWSAGCILIGASSDFSEYNSFIETVYPTHTTLSNTTYKGNNIKYSNKNSVYSGIVVVDRFLYTDKMEELYKNAVAVKVITANSVDTYKKVKGNKQNQKNNISNDTNEDAKKNVGGIYPTIIEATAKIAVQNIKWM